MVQTGASGHLKCVATLGISGAIESRWGEWCFILLFIIILLNIQFPPRLL